MNDYQQEFLESQDHIPTSAEICPQSPAPVAYLLLTNMKAMIRCLEHTPMCILQDTEPHATRLRKAIKKNFPEMKGNKDLSIKAANIGDQATIVCYFSRENWNLSCSEVLIG